MGRVGRGRIRREISESISGWISACMNNGLMQNQKKSLSVTK